MHGIAEEILAASQQLDQSNFTPMQRLVFHELQEKLRLALDEIAELSIMIACQADTIEELKAVNLEST